MLGKLSLSRAAATFASNLPRGSYTRAAIVATGAFFDAGTASRERTAMTPSLGDADRVQTATTRLAAMGQARALYANDGLTGGAVESIARFAYPLWPRYNTGNEADDAALDTYFRTVWAPQCDAHGLMSWAQFQKSCGILRLVDGDCGIRLVRDSAGVLRLRLIEAHRIGSEDKYGDRSYSDGVRLSADGTPLAYRIQPVDRTKPLDGLFNYSEAVDVPAAEFILYRHGTRPTAYRGFTALARAVHHLHDRKDIVRFTKTAVKTASTIAFALYKNGGQTGDEWDDSGADATDATGVILAKLQAGQIPVLDSQTKEKLESFNDNRPGPNTVAFLDHLTRDVAVGLGMPYEFVWNPSAVGGTGQRAILEQAAWRFAEEQDDFIHAVGNRVAALVALDAVRTGRVKLSGRPDLATLLRAPEWQRPAEISVDRGQAREDREDIAAGAATLDMVAGRNGRDWQALRKQKETEADDLLIRARRLADTHAIPLPTALDLLSRSAPGGTQPAPGTDPAKPTDSTPPPAKPAPSGGAGAGDFRRRP